MFDKPSSSEDAREPFLAPGSHHQDDWERMSVRRRRINYPAIATHCTIALVYLLTLTITGTSWFNRSSSMPACTNVDSAAEIYYPAEEAVEHQLVDFPLRDFYHDNPFVGDPRPEHDEAWRNLLWNMNVRFTEDEMQKMNLTSLKLKDGSGYVGSFMAYHDIHCVHWIRKWMHREHYWPYLEGDALRERKVHIEHCLDRLRLNAMCHAERAVSTYEWMGAFPRPTVEQQHKCVNWEKFDAWNAERRVDLFDADAFEGRPPLSPMCTQEEEANLDVRLGTKPGSLPGDDMDGAHK
ncbi:hypothetical protein B0H66DRAFT_532033 [Apodospora peruviana]|uniref:Uncharacterized protein n=1 Tax=Apodospora peruviana TaxID=516989 RepID=A0AAE0ICV7_9PEZI|nr:hypothetical protein B0H66DRAFT_532033 [Apodospora peruviana]